MIRRQLPPWLVAAVLLAAGALIAWWIAGQSNKPLTLPDGSEVTLLATTYGTSHLFAAGSYWVKLGRRFISPGRAYKLGLREYRQVIDKPGLLIWTYWRFPSTNQFRIFASVRDRHGVESEPNSPIVFAPTPGRSEALIAWGFKSFPTRQKELLLRFHERDVMYRAVFLAEMPVPNPVRGPFPDWPTSTPLVSVRQDGFVFSLLELRSGGPAPKQSRPTGGSVAPWNTAHFEVRTNGNVDGAWRVRRLEALGVTGNTFSLSVPEVQRRGDQIVTEFANALWPDEPAWKLNVEFSRTDRFAPDEMWTMRAVPIRPGGSLILSNLSITANGVTLTNLELYVLPPMQIRPAKGSPNMEVKLGFSQPPRGLRVDLHEAIDNRGRELTRDEGQQIPASSYQVRFHVHPDSESVDLTFVVHQSHFVEFLVKPVFVTTNAPSALPAPAKPATNAPR